jgi:response regulator of citrate/malate metabolism
MREFTARSFAQEYRICDSTARRYLESLVKKGIATALQKPFTMMSNGKEIALKRTVRTYRLK